MNLVLESEDLNDYLMNLPEIGDYNAPSIQAVINEIQSQTQDIEEQARLAFILARDEITHSFDIKSEKNNYTATKTLEDKEGICFAKSHLLTALLRGLGIPSGFCYQRVLKTKNLDDGFALHGLNALYINKYGWFRVDPRGNKEGVYSDFSPLEEKLAYPIRENLGEIDYKNILIKPYPSVIQYFNQVKSFNDLFNNRPAELLI